MHFEERPQGTVAVRPRGFRHAVVDVARFTLLGNQAGVLQEPEVPGDVRLRDAEDAGQFGHVETVGRQNAKQPQPRRVGKEPKKRGRLLHIYKSTYIDTTESTVGRLKPALRTEAP